MHTIFGTHHELDAVLDRLNGTVYGFLCVLDQVLARCANVFDHAALAGHGIDLIECFQDEVLC